MNRSLLLAVVLCTAAQAQAPIRWAPATESLALPIPLVAETLFRTASGALVAGSDAGLYRSDGGGPWERVTRGSLQSAQAVAWAAVGSERYVAARTSGVLASTDDGRTWTAAGLSGLNVIGLAALPDGALVATDGRGQTYRREPSATAWTSLGTPDPACYSYYDALDALADGTLLVSCLPDLYRSVDRGTTWTRTGQRSFGSLAQTPAGAVFLLEYPSTVLRSLDSGVTWASVGQAPSGVTGPFEAGEDGFLYVAVASPSGSGVFRSSDGASWTWAFRGDGRPTALLTPGGTELVVSQSETGTTRVDLTTGAAVLNNAGVVREPAADVMSSAGAWTVFTAWRFSRRGLYRTHDRGASWTVVPDPPGVEYIYSVLVLEDGTILVGSSSTVSRTSDGGQTWASAALPVVSGWYTIASTITRTRTGALLAGAEEQTGIATLGAVFRSDDGGQTWTRAAQQQVVGPVVAIVEGAGGALFAGHRLAGFEGAGGALMRSDDDGRTWTVVREGSVDAIAPIDGGRFLIATIGEDGTYRLARASETGAPWELLGPAPGRPDGLLRAADGAVYLVGWSAGIQRTTDDGDSWQTVTDGLPDRRVSVLTQDAEGFLYAGTPTGIARSERAAVAGEPGPAPAAVALERPRPNPASGVTAFAFTLADGGDVDLGLYDALGRRVATLAQGALGPGRHTAAWTLSGVPPGVYLAVLHAPGGVATQPVTVVR